MLLAVMSRHQLLHLVPASPFTRILTFARHTAYGTFLSPDISCYCIKEWVRNGLRKRSPLPGFLLSKSLIGQPIVTSLKIGNVAKGLGRRAHGCILIPCSLQRPISRKPRLNYFPSPVVCGFMTSCALPRAWVFFFQPGIFGDPWSESAPLSTYPNS